MSSTASSAVGSCSAATNNDDETKPLWKYVKKGAKVSGGGGNIKITCTICNENFNGTYSRVKAHLLKIGGGGVRKCSQISNETIVQLRKEIERADLKAQESLPKNVSLPTDLSNSQPVGTSASVGVGSFRLEGLEQNPYKRKVVENSAIGKCTNIKEREQLQGEIARMFYTGGLPFHLARNPHYQNSYTMASKGGKLQGFVPPGYNLLRTTLLDKERAHVEYLLLDIKASWKECGVSLVTDGWTDFQRRPLINFVAISERGPMFLKAVNCQGEYKDSQFIADLITKIIEEVGPSNVVQIITNNAPVCRAAGLAVESKYPQIFWTPCVVHTLNLALKNICAPSRLAVNEIAYDECNWIAIVADDASMIKNFIMNHSMRLAMFNRFVKLKMLSIAETRFASVMVMLKRFLMIKRGLQNMVISDQWSLYRVDNVKKVQFVKDKVLDDLWWDQIRYILSFTEPIYDMLRVADTDKPCLHLVYDIWDTMIEKVKVAIYRHEMKQDTEASVFYDVVYGILIDRWTKSNTPLHCLAHSLNPRYYSAEWLNGGKNRVAPHKDMEVASERKACLKRLFPNADERRKVNLEFAEFSTGAGGFNDRDFLHDRTVYAPKLWWTVHGDVAPMLQSLALKLLGQPSSSSCSERNWSTYSFIHSVKRNKMTPQRAENLVFVHNNLRLLSRKSANYYKGETKMWDIGGDAFEMLDGTGLLEVADLSYDEPDLEKLLFDDDDIDDDIGDDDDDVTVTDA